MRLCSVAVTRACLLGAKCHRVRRFLAFFGVWRKGEHAGSRQEIEGDEDEGCDHSCVTLLKTLTAACGGWQLQKKMLC